jgi:hypothetical protein
LPEEWLDLGRDVVTGRFSPVAGKGLWYDDDGRGHWRPVLINGYDRDRNIFTGNWDDDDY